MYKDSNYEEIEIDNKIWTIKKPLFREVCIYLLDILLAAVLRLLFPFLINLLTW